MTRTKRQKRIRAAIRAAKANRSNCPNPTKRGYSQSEILIQTMRVSAAGGRPIAFYKCKCGMWHLTTKRISNA